VLLVDMAQERIYRIEFPGVGRDALR
jgi:hypothetical protein